MTDYGGEKIPLSQKQVKSYQTELINKDLSHRLETLAESDLEEINLEINKEEIIFRPKLDFYRYLISFLLVKYAESFDIESEEDIAKISSKIYKDIEENKKNQIIETMLDLALEDFKKNKMAKPDSNKVYGSLDFSVLWDKKSLRRLFRSSKISRESLLVLSFGLNMDLEITEIFLKKALRDQGLDFWKPDEFIIYHVKESFGNNIEAYQRLKKLYDDIDISDIKKEKEPQISYVTELLQGDFSSLGLGNSKKDKKYVLEKLKDHKLVVSKDIKRTVNKIFLEVYDSVNKNLEREINEFSIFTRGNFNKSLDGDYHKTYEYFSKGKLRLYYDSDRQLEIKKGQAFKWEKIAKNPSENEKKDDPISFYAVSDYIGEKRDFVEVLLPVKSYDKFDKSIKKGKFYFEDKALNEKLIEAKYKSKISESKKDGKTEILLNLKIRPLDLIKKSTRLVCDDKVFEVAKDTLALPFLEIEVSSKATIDMGDLPRLSENEEDDKFYYKYINEIEGVRAIDHKGINIDKHKITSLLSYLFTDKAILNTDGKTDLPYPLLEKLDLTFDKIMITDANISNARRGDSSRITRDKLITILFIKYCLMLERELVNRFYTGKEIKRMYLSFMKDYLRRCHFYEYNISDGYEEILLRLICTEEPLNTFRYLWANYLIYKGEKNE